MQHKWLLRDAQQTRTLQGWYRKRKPELAGDAAGEDGGAVEDASGSVVPSQR